MWFFPFKKGRWQNTHYIYKCSTHFLTGGGSLTFFKVTCAFGDVLKRQLKWLPSLETFSETEYHVFNPGLTIGWCLLSSMDWWEENIESVRKRNEWDFQNQMKKECVLWGVLSVSVDVCPFFVTADTQPQCSLSRTAAYRVEVRDYKPVRMHISCWYPSR